MDFKVYFLLTALFVVVSSVSGCEDLRKTGLFTSEYSNVDGFEGDTGRDNDDAAGDSIDVTLQNSYSLFSTTQSSNIVKISDYGQIIVHGTGTPIAYDGSNHYRTDEGYFAAFWFGTGLDSYGFTYRHITTSVNQNGLEFGGGSQCDLKRFESIIADCRISLGRSITLDEMLIVTHRWTEGVDVLLAQSVLGFSSDGDTYVAFIYEGAPSTTVLNAAVEYVGIVNGIYPDAGSLKYGRICTGVSPYVNLHLESNCLCNTWNQGVYLFYPKGGSPAAGERYQECTDTTACGTSINDANFWPYAPDANPNCMKTVIPTDTCLEEAYCAVEGQTSASDAITSFKIKITLLNPVSTHLVFLNVGDLDMVSQTVTPIDSCKGPLVSNAFERILQVSNIGTDAACGVSWETNAADQTLEFAVWNYNDGEENFELSGNRIIRGKCNYFQAPKYVTQEFDASTPEPITVVAKGIEDREVKLNVGIKKEYEDNVIPVNGEVFLGQDMFLLLTYWRSTVADNADPYGAYGFSCKVSKASDFPNDANTIEIIGSDGCVTGLSSDDAFHIQSAFEDVTFSGTDAADINWAMSSGKIDAAKWIGNSHDIYFRCEIALCWNIVLRDSSTDSRCQDSCTGAAENSRRRRSERSNSTLVAETSVRVVRNSEPNEPGNQRRRCIDNTVAMATLLCMLIAILPLAGINVAFVYKLFFRKRV